MGVSHEKHCNFALFVLFICVLNETPPTFHLMQFSIDFMRKRCACAVLAALIMRISDDRNQKMLFFVGFKTDIFLDKALFVCYNMHRTFKGGVL